MSSGNKSLVYAGGKGTNKNKSQQHGKSDHHSKTTDTAKHEKGQSNKDQAKHSQINDTRFGIDPAMRERITQVIEVTRRSEDEVIMALYDTDWDFNRAVNDLLEGVYTEWEVKKKKPRQPSGSKQTADPSVDHDESGGGDWDERRNQRGGGPPRMRGRANHDNRGWRGRENKENERNIEDNVREGGYSGGRRGRGGSGRSSRGGRGGGRGLGPRAYTSRGDAASSSGTHSFNRPIDTWTGSEEQQQSNQDSKMAGDPWNNLEPSEDWENEEYTGSLADTKVFTPSTSTNDQSTDDSKNSLDTNALSSVQSGNISGLPQEELAKLSDGSAMQSQQTAIIQSQTQQSQHSPVSQQTLGLPTPLQLSQQSGTLTAAQSQYLTQLTQQSSENYKGASQPAFTSMTITNQPQRQAKQRSRVPPPSKIPSSAVEMPGDTVNSGIGFLDVQFGALEFGGDTTTVDAANTDKYNSSSTNITGIDASSNVITTGVANSTTATSNTLDIDTAQQGGSYNTSSQMIASPNNAGINYGNAGPNSATYQSQKTSYQTSNNAPSSYNTYSSTGGQAVQSSFSTSSGGNTNSYTSATPVSQSGYSTTTSYPQSNASTFSQASPSAPSSTGTSGYNQTTTSNQVYQSSSGFVPATTGQYQVPQSTNPGVNSNTAGYQATSYQGSASFQSSPQAYQPSVTTFTSPITQASSSAYQSTAHSVYGSVYGTYNNQSQVTSHNHTKLNSASSKDSQYDNNTTTSSNSLATTSAPSLGLSSASVNSSQTKVTSSNVVPKSTSSGSTVTGTGGSGSITGASGVGGAASSITPMLGNQYIMGHSVPYAAFQQPMYSYEDLQLMQQRIPHMPTTGYYDATLGYQTTGPATSLGGGRNDALSGVQGVQSVQGVQGAYNSMNDGRFARNDSNASPVPSTMSQQTATQHQQPMMNPTLPPGYAYFAYGGSIMPGSFQYGGPPIYPQIATAGNAGTNSGAYSTKPGSYGSGYGGGTSYDTLANAGPTGEYKGTGSGYTGTQTGKTGSSTGNNNSGGSSAADMGATMYAKNHVALSKVNSYDKQTFHSATPAPFGLTSNQNAGMPGGYGAPHLFISPLPHQLHQPLHQDGNSSSGQRSNASSQNKAQAKPGYSSTYWATGN